MANTRPKNKKTLKACFSQAALVGSNDDLLTEILLRLPVTSILRFKSVSKHWLCLLSDRHFTQRYDNLSKSPPGLFGGNINIYVPFDVKHPSTPPFHSLDSYFDRPRVRIVQSCNGLLLCSTDRGPKGYKGALRYYVFNPTTKQLALIPPVPGGPKARKTLRLMGLAYHQTDCVHYKVICVLRGPDADSYQILIYSSDAREWKISVRSFSEPIHSVRQGVYWNGAVYWASYHDHTNFLYFKIDDEQLQPLPLPVGLMSSEIVTVFFGESRGHLHLIAYKNRQENWLRLNVYEMLSDHSGWFVKYQVELDALPDAFPEMISQYFVSGYDFKVVDVVRGEVEEDAFLVLKTPKRIITYNVHDKSFKQIYTFIGYSYEGNSSFHRYTETLSSF